MSTDEKVVPLLVFEAADCLMAVVASEVGHLEKGFRDPFSEVSTENGSRNRFDLGEYFAGSESDGPWLTWARGTRHARLRVCRVVDVVPVSLGGLTPMPALLRAQKRTQAFLAAGIRGEEVFLLLDPARLVN